MEHPARFIGANGVRLQERTSRSKDAFDGCDLQYTISDYRDKLYLDIVRRKKELRRRRDARPGARPVSHSLYRPSAADDASGYAYTNARQP